ncbi:hypothetical protein HYN96_20530 [Vibrio parahaemolyticus]|nr:hypothetical protein [Vibrio parahaemolyticus]
MNIGAIVSLFYQIESLDEFVLATSKELDKQTAELLWEALTDVYESEQKNHASKGTPLGPSCLNAEHVSLEKGIKYFLSDCPACTQLFKVATGQYDNVLCPHCGASGGMDSIEFKEATTGIQNELKLFEEWYNTKHKEAPWRYPLRHLGVNSQWRRMFVEFMFSDEKEEYKHSRTR